MLLVYFWFFHRHLNYLPGESEYEAYFNHFSNSEKSFFLDEITLCGSCYLMRVIFFQTNEMKREVVEKARKAVINEKKRLEKARGKIREIDSAVDVVLAR